MYNPIEIVLCFRLKNILNGCDRLYIPGLVNFSPLPVTVVTLHDNNTSRPSDLRSEKDAGPRDLNFCPERPKSLTNKIVLNNKEINH